MRLRTAALFVSLTLSLLAACATTPQKDDFSYLRTPTTFRSFVIKDNSYSTTYTSPAGWLEGPARNSFVYWNAVMAIRTGNRCFVLDDVHTHQREEIGTADSSMPPSVPGAPLTIRAPVSYFEFTAITKLFADCTVPNAIDAHDYLSRTQHPDKAPRF